MVMLEPNRVDEFVALNVEETIDAGLLSFSYFAERRSTAHAYELFPMKNDVADPSASYNPRMVMSKNTSPSFGNGPVAILWTVAVVADVCLDTLVPANLYVPNVVPHDPGPNDV